MACAGVIASAGAQLDFTVLNVSKRTVNKTDYYGFNSSVGGHGSLSNATLETQSGTVRTCTVCEDQGTNFIFTASGCEDSDVAGFKTIVIGDVKLARSSRASYNSGSFVFGSFSSTVLEDANGSSLIVQLRAD